MLLCAFIPLPWLACVCFPPIHIASLTRRAEDETAPAFVERQWRVGRNQAITADALAIRDAGCKRLDTQVAFLHVHESETSSLLFHPYDPLLAVGDEQGAVSVWALDDGTKLNAFSNTTVPSTAPRITNMLMLNEVRRVQAQTQTRTSQS